MREEDTHDLVIYVTEPGTGSTSRAVLPLVGNEVALEVKAWLSELGKELARREHRIEKHPHLVDAEGRLLGAEE